MNGISSKNQEEAYISVDIETAGPAPSLYSMLTLGACVVDAPTQTFYAELQPINDNLIPEALSVTGLSLEKLRSSGKPPSVAMKEFGDWISRVSARRRPVFVGFNAPFDWAFVNWYFQAFVGKNPLGIGGVDIKAYYMGMTGCYWYETSSSKLPAEFQPSRPQTHNALEDAQAQAEIFVKMLASNGRRLNTKSS